MIGYEGSPRREVVKKIDGLLFIDGATVRYLTWREALVYRLFGRMPKR
jgi:hypothetical protein